MHQRKEPHRRLSEHMAAAHDMVWSDEQNKYVKKQSDQKPIEPKDSSAEQLLDRAQDIKPSVMLFFARKIKC
jgi:hypothetical protein